MDELLTLYKLMILYMLDRVDFPLSGAQISDFMLISGYTNYFRLQESLSDLSGAGMIREEKTRSRTLYHLTEDGAGTIGLLHTDISPDIRRDIDRYLKEHHFELKEEVAVKADYYKNTSGDYTVNCQVLEKSVVVFSLTITAPSEAEAKKAVENFHAKNQELYAHIMANLM